METISIQTTRNYGQFRSLFGNRLLKPDHIKKLVKSMQEVNLMSFHPVLVTEDGYIIDGQHRIEAAKELGIDVHFITIPDASLQTVQLLNSNVKSWTMRDFCESYAKLGNENYVRLLAFSDRYNIPITVSANLLANKNVVTGGGAASDIRDGTFHITNEENAKETMKRLSELQSFSDASCWRAREFIRSLVYMYSKGMKHYLLLEQLQKTGKRLQRQASNRDYLFQFLDVYNHGLKKNRLSIID